MKIEEISHLAKLSSLELSTDQTQQISKELENILRLVDELQSVDTKGIEPLFHPIAMIDTLSQPFRTDIVSEGNDRTNNMLSAPVSHEGLFLVPKVIE
jgi:aspartyl-tRNA(Asn)/glutamyl-tRNA(Gln) amidotransferase subunit C